MARPEGWRDWLMAQWRKPRPSAGARLLQPLSWLYGGLYALREHLYAWGALKTVPSPVPVIVVGNLVAGGAGKTPAVMAVVHWLQSQGRSVGVISRGHGRRDDGLRLVSPGSTPADVGDEPLLIHLRTGVPVAVGRDRAAAVALLHHTHPQLDLIVADDGLQHRRLGRHIEVLLFDDRGVGNGLLLPAGPLRQPLPEHSASKRLVLYSGGRRTTALPGHLGHRRLTGVLPLRDWWTNPHAATQPMATLQGKPLLAAAGLARPEAFFDMLDAAGLSIQRLPMLDHDRLDRLPWLGARGEVIVTEKDAVKLQPDRAGCEHVWVAQLDFTPEPAFFAALASQLRRCATPHS